ncbi:hypothetical protein LEMLEM_LOCUS22476 [Lemmus lemmus]
MVGLLDLYSIHSSHLSSGPPFLILRPLSPPGQWTSEEEDLSPHFKRDWHC